MKIATVVGARPQFIKAAVLSRLIREEYSRQVSEFIIHTGQHYDPDMSDIFFDELDIPRPHVNLEVGSGRHGAMTAEMLTQLEAQFLDLKPDLVLVYGDTNSTLAAALAAVKMQIPVAHVEAGLRSFNWQMPEEINRVVTDRISRWLFCPTPVATRNLAQEGVNPKNFFLVGDVMLDSVLYHKSKAKLSKELEARLADFSIFAVATVHRAENTDHISRLSQISQGLNALAERQPILFPVHPRTRGALQKLPPLHPNIHLLAPLGYLEMLALVNRSGLVLTDSGGLQKEAAFLGKACVILRDETEWLELVEQGVSGLAGANPSKITALATEFMNREIQFKPEFFGNGLAGKKILETLIS